MPVKIRLQRRGRRKLPYYHIVVADVRAPRGGRFIEKLGSYNPMTKPATIELDVDRAYDWLLKGAQPTDTARAILKFKGVLYKKHLQRGVAKGALTQEEADAKFQAWITDKESKVAERRKQAEEEKAAFLKQVSGKEKEYVPKSHIPADVPAEEEVVAAAEVAAEAGEQVAETAEEVAKDATEAGEQVAEAAEEVAEDTAEAAKEAAEAVVEKAEEAADAVKEAAGAASETQEDDTEAADDSGDAADTVAEEVTGDPAEESTEQEETADSNEEE